MAPIAKLNPATSKTYTTNLLFLAFTMAYEDFGIDRRFFHKSQKLLQVYGTKALLRSNNYPAGSNFDVTLKTTTGGIDVEAKYTPQGQRHGHVRINGCA